MIFKLELSPQIFFTMYSIPYTRVRIRDFKVYEERKEFPSWDLRKIFVSEFVKVLAKIFLFIK